MLCLVSGGADSTCLLLALGELGYRVSALHVDHRPAGRGVGEPTRDFARTSSAPRSSSQTAAMRSEARLRELRYALAPDRLRATGHTASDQVETIIYRLATSGNTKGIKARREDGVVRPLLRVWREETESFCTERGVGFRRDSSNRDTVRGLIGAEILPLVDSLHPVARANILRSLEQRPTMPPALAELLGSPTGSRRIDLGGGMQAVREHDRLWLESGPGQAPGRGQLGAVAHPLAAAGPYRARLEGRGSPRGTLAKIQDVFVDASVPRSEREAWPLVVRGDEVVAVPGIVDADGIEAVRL